MTRPARHAVCTACGLTPFVCVIQRGAHFPYCPLCYYFTAMIPPLPFMKFAEALTLQLWLDNF